MPRRYGCRCSFASAIPPVRWAEARIAGVLYGREADCAAVEGLIAGAGSSQSGALVVRGDPGLGKSALLGHATDHATGMRVLRAVGIEAESELAFAALHQLVRPTLDLLTHLPEPQAAALAGALGLSRVSVQDRFLQARRFSRPSAGP